MKVTWLSTGMFLAALMSMGPSQFVDPGGHLNYESPFDANAPFPMLAAIKGDSPSYWQAKKSDDWPL